MAIRRRLVGLLIIVTGLLGIACVQTGEIEVRNATDGSLLVLVLTGPGACDSPSFDEARHRWVGVSPGETRAQIVVSGSWLGDACLNVATANGLRVTTVKVERGRAYEVTQTGQILNVEDVGGHDQPWYLEASDYDFSFSSWWVWYYGVILVLGGPPGLFITVRFFYKYYVQHQG